MKLVLIGMPGSGKSTQGNILSSQFGIPYLSTGHIFRNLATENSELGRYVKKNINTGSLIPDEKVMSIIEEYLSRPEYKKGYILDGFPRTLRQAREFDDSIDRVLYLEIPNKEALWRLAFRNDALRSDDTITTIKKRIDIFHAQTKPVIDFYKEKNTLSVVDGTKIIDQVNKQILLSLGKEIVHDKVQNVLKKAKSLICLVGLPGSGKTEAAHFFKAKSIPIIDFGSIVNSYISQKKLKHTNEEHKKIRIELRKQFGMEAFAKMREKEIKTALQNNPVVVIDSVRPFEEYEYLKKKFKHAHVVIIALYSDKKDRYRRIEARKERNLLTGEERDISELSDTNMGKTIAYADYLLINSGSIDDFKSSLEKTYQDIIVS